MDVKVLEWVVNMDDRLSTYKRIESEVAQMLSQGYVLNSFQAMPYVRGSISGTIKGSVHTSPGFYDFGNTSGKTKGSTSGFTTTDFVYVGLFIKKEETQEMTLADLDI